MYKVYNKSEAIRQIQRFLSKINHNDVFVAPTGVFDDNTTNATKNFQLQNGLNPTGIVDKLTYDMLYTEYLLEKERETAHETMIPFPLSRGESNDSILAINKILMETLDHYGYTHRIRATNYFSSETEKAAKVLSTIYLLEYNGYIDEIFYLRLLRDYYSLKQIFS